ncbi:MAG: hypothetical protein ACI4W6_08315, partial [Acutalibacteraceae bacterium]
LPRRNCKILLLSVSRNICEHCPPGVARTHKLFCKKAWQKTLLLFSLGFRRGEIVKAYSFPPPRQQAGGACQKTLLL